MPLNPKLKEYVDFVENLKERLFANGFKPNQSNEREAIAAFVAKYMTERNDDVETIDDVVMRDGYPIPIRCYFPSFGELYSVCVFIHGGGHMTGGIVVYDGISRKLAKTANAIIVSIDYRLAPEFGYPVGLDDCRAVVSTIFDVLDERKIRYADKNLTLIGDSSGGTFCATICADKAFVKKYNVKKQILICPLLDYTLAGDSSKIYGEGYLLDRRELNFYFLNYFQNNEDLKGVSPLFGDFYHQMPKTLIVAAEFDPLYDDSTRYFELLRQNGAIDSEFLRVSGVVHPFLMLQDICAKECEAVYEKIAHFYKP